MAYDDDTVSHSGVCCQHIANRQAVVTIGNLSSKEALVSGILDGGLQQQLLPTFQNLPAPLSEINTQVLIMDNVNDNIKASEYVRVDGSI